MSTHKNIDRICVVITVLCLLLTAAFMFGERLGIERIVDEDAEAHSDSVYFSANDCDGNWDASDATVITLNGSDASVSGKGAYACDGGVVISNGGYYVLSGTLTDGSVTVDAYKSSKVWLRFDGVEISCSDDACLRVDEADKVFLTLAGENRLSSGESYSDTALSDGTDGVIFAHDDLTINGSGSLTVSAAYRHGIAANDDLVITGGTITVSAPADAIHANDSLRVRDASITVDAGDDGIVVDNEGGYLYIESGAFDLTSADDAIHAAGDITVAGGTLTIAAGDDGIHSDTAITIGQGTIQINECYEGIEAITIEQSGGDITIHSADDGLNANGGASTPGGFPGKPAESGGMQMPQTSGEETWIRISGGTLTILNENGHDADGLDSNGNIYITGGAVRVSLTGDGSNSALDYGSENGGVAIISGGTLIACGGSSMAERFDSGSTQPSALYNFAAPTEDGTVLTLEDMDGNVLLNWEVPYRFTSALISSPDMKLSETYRMTIGDSAEALTLEKVSASYGEAQGSFGMRPGRGDFDGQRPDMGDFDGQRPDMGDFDGQRPDMGDFDGQRPDMGDFDGQRPDMGDFDGQRPDMGDFDAQRPDMGGFDGRSPAMNQPENSKNAISAQTETGQSVVSTQTWMLLGLCALALAAAILIAKCFRRH